MQDNIREPIEKLTKKNMIFSNDKLIIRLAIGKLIKKGNKKNISNIRTIWLLIEMFFSYFFENKHNVKPIIKEIVSV